MLLFHQIFEGTLKVLPTTLEKLLDVSTVMKRFYSTSTNEKSYELKRGNNRDGVKRKKTTLG